MHQNKVENVHRFALSAIRGELLERDLFGILYRGYLKGDNKKLQHFSNAYCSASKHATLMVHNSF